MPFMLWGVALLQSAFAKCRTSSDESAIASLGPFASSLRVPQLLSAQIVSYSSMSNPKLSHDAGLTYSLPALQL